MTVNLVQSFDYSSKFISCLSVKNSFIFSMDDGLLVVDLESDFFRPTADYKLFRTLLAYSEEKPFEDKNFKEIRYQRPVVCFEHNLTLHPQSLNCYVVYMVNNSNIVFLEKKDDNWIEKLSNIPQTWFHIVSKKPSFLINQKNLNNQISENEILYYCREREKSIQIKNFVFTHILKEENGTEVHGTICCHLNNLLTFWSTTSEKSYFLLEYEFHNISISHMKWFQVSNDLSWLIVILTNGQIYVHEICNYPHVQHSFILWSDEDFAHVKNIWIEITSNKQCFIFFTKMSFILMILYSLTEKKILLTKREMIPKTAFISGLTFVVEKQLLLLVTDVGKFICIYFSATISEVSYTLKTVNNNFNELVQNYMCTSVVFSKNQCTCALTFESNMAKYSKNDGQVKNKILFCIIPEHLVEIETKILLVNDYDYNDVIDCIETFRINRMNDKSNEVYQLDRKLLDNCSIQSLKLTYWSIAFMGKKTEHDNNILQELQTLLHVAHLINRFSNNKKIFTNSDRYFCRILLSYYSKKLPMDYVKIKSVVANLIKSFQKAKHTLICKTCECVITSYVDLRMFICELEHKELRCPVTLGPLGSSSLVCSMCFTMVSENTRNQSCIWCFGKYIDDKLLF